MSEVVRHSLCYAYGETMNFDSCVRKKCALAVNLLGHKVPIIGEVD